VNRRTFLTDIAAGAIAPVVASDLVGHGFSAALRARPSAEAWQGKLAAYGRDYMTAGGDPRTQVWVRGRAAIALGYEGAALPVARMFADQALALDPSPSLGRLNAIMGKAHAAALSGDGQAARELLAQGQWVFDAAGSGDGEESDYAVPWWRMNVFTSLLAARLGDEPLAVQAQRPRCPPRCRGSRPTWSCIAALCWPASATRKAGPPTRRRRWRRCRRRSTR
jgi:hypothetical protein